MWIIAKRQGDPKLLMQFSDKHVVVTGASRGIGYAIARAFQAEGAQVTLIASSDAVVDAAAALNRDGSATVGAIKVDIANRRDVENALGQSPRVDILINNAGLEQITPIDDLSDACADQFERIININVLGTFYVTRALLPSIPDGGRIILTSSIWGNTAVGEFSAYCASKHANIGFMRSLAQELGPRDITVNAVCPGWVRTSAAMRSLTQMAQRTQISEQALLQSIVSNQAIETLLEPDDVVAPYLFLASEAAGTITGQTLTVDRGEVMA